MNAGLYAKLVNYDLDLAKCMFYCLILVGIIISRGNGHHMLAGGHAES